jgi:hypothetical protein
MNWEQANPFAIQIDEGADVWHAGHVNDVLSLDSGGIVVATDTGGVWSIDSQGDALPLSDDWDSPDMTCLAFGPDGPRHIYAGSSNGALYETDTSTIFTLANWRQLTLPPDVGTVYRIGVLNETRRIVLACAKAVWWSPIPPAPSAKGNYVWKMAQGLPNGTYSGLALGPNDTIAVAAWGANVGTGLYGIFHGDWSTVDLVMSRATLTGNNEGPSFVKSLREAAKKSGITNPPISVRPLAQKYGFDPPISLRALVMTILTSIDISKLLRTSLASCDQDRRFMYAAIAGPDDFIYTVLQSTDGGLTWSPCGGATIEDSIKFLRPPHGGETGNQGGYNNCIAVSPFTPRIIALGWRRGPFISTDGGQTWVEHGDDGSGNNRSKHLHSDLHAVYFDPTDSTGQRLYVGSDGGVAMTPDLGQNFQSNFNRQLCNLQFCSNPARGFYGTLSASYQFSGLVGGGLQDNEDVYCLVGQNLTPWKEIGVGGDGSVILFIETGQLLYNGAGTPMKLAKWDGNNFQEFGVIPITVPKPNAQPDPSGIHGPAVAGIVISPTFRNGANQLMYIVASGSGPDSPDVYGLFGDENGNNMHWEYIGSVSSPVYALGSFNGGTVFVGTKDGRIFALEPFGAALELNVPIRNSKKGAVHHLLVPSDRLAFATFNTGSEGFVLRLDFLVGWDALGGGLPSETFFALEMDWTVNPMTIFAATNAGVYVSGDNGDTWQSASQGLPKRPHCADLRFVTQSSGEHDLYLSTYGRSVWQAQLK